jgi:hypothetical protein
MNLVNLSIYDLIIINSYYSDIDKVSSIFLLSYSFYLILSFLIIDISDLVDEEDDTIVFSSVVVITLLLQLPEVSL